MTKVKWSIETNDVDNDFLREFRGCGQGRANYQSSNEMYQYQYYMHGPQTEQYGPPCSLCGSFNHSPKHCYKGEMT